MVAYLEKNKDYEEVVENVLDYFDSDYLKNFDLDYCLGNFLDWAGEEGAGFYGDQYLYYNNIIDIQM